MPLISICVALSFLFSSTCCILDIYNQIEMNEKVEGVQRNHCSEWLRRQYPGVSYIVVYRSDWNCLMCSYYRSKCGRQWHEQRNSERHKLQLEQLQHHHHHHHHHQQQQQQQQQVHRLQHLMHYKQNRPDKSRREQVEDQYQYQHYMQSLQWRLQRLHSQYRQEHMPLGNHRRLQQASDPSYRVGDSNRVDDVQKPNLPDTQKRLLSFNPEEDQHQGYSRSHQVKNDEILKQLELAQAQRALQSSDIRPNNRKLVELDNEDLSSSKLKFMVQNPYQERPATSISQNDEDKLECIINEPIVFPSKFIESVDSNQNDVAKMDTGAVLDAAFSPEDLSNKRSDVNASLVSPMTQVSLVNRFEVFKELAKSACEGKSCDSRTKHNAVLNTNSDSSKKHRFIRFIS